jgi:hypothetical protein
MANTSLLVYPPQGKQIQDTLAKCRFNVCFNYNFRNARITQPHMVAFGNDVISTGEQLLYPSGILPREIWIVTVAELSVDRELWHGHGAAQIRSRANLVKFLRNFPAAMFDLARRFMRDRLDIRHSLPNVTCTPMSAEESDLWWGYINKDGFTDADGDRFSFGHPRQR